MPFVDTDVVSLGFKSDIAGEFTIALSNFDGLFTENQDIYLKDNVTGTLQNKFADYTFFTQVEFSTIVLRYSTVALWELTIQN